MIAQPRHALRTLALTVALLLSLLVIGTLTLQQGTPTLTLAQLVDLLFAGEGERVTRIVVLELRLPRLMLGIASGALLALSGVILQDTLRNPLAGPELLGITGGAAVVVGAITIFRLPAPAAIVPWFTLAGGLAGGLVVLLAAQLIRNTPRLILVGASVTALLNALLISMISLATQNDVNLLFLFLLGSLANRTWAHVAIVLPWALIGVPVALLCARLLNVLQLGDDLAAGLGLAVAPTRLLLLVVGAGLVAAVVAVCGPIGWVALLAPHLARRALATPNAVYVLPTATLIGAVLLTSADLLARLALAPTELPVGIWTTLLGGPLLLLLLRSQFGARHE
jgi:iron complex transport system permease protein